MDQNEPVVMQELSNRAQSNVAKRILIGLIVLGLLAITAFVTINFFPELVLSPKIMYLMAEKKSIDTFGKQLDSYNDDYAKDVLKALETSYQSKSDITMKINAGNLDIFGSDAQQVKMVADFLKNATLSIEQSGDKKKEQARTKLSFTAKGTKLIDIDMFLDKDRGGISVPAIYSKYITFSKDLTPIFEKFGMDAKIKKIPTPQDILNAIKVDKKELNSIQKDYVKFFADSIQKSDITYDKSSEFATSDGDLKARKITITLDSARQKEIAKKLVEKVSKDEKLLNLIATNVVNVGKVFEDAGLPVDEKMTDKDKIKEQITDSLEELQESIDDSESKTKFVMNVFIDRNYNVLNREIKIIDNSREAEKPSTVTYRIANYKNPKTKNVNKVFEFATQSEFGSGGKLTVSYAESKNTKAKTEGVVDIRAVSIYGGKSQELFEGKVDLTIENEDANHRVITADFSISPSEDLGVGDMKFYGKVTEKLERVPKDKTLKTDFDYSINVKAPNAFQSEQEMGISLAVKNSLKYGAPVEMPKLSKENTLDLNTASTEEIQSAIMSAQPAAMQLGEKITQLMSGY